LDVSQKTALCFGTEDCGLSKITHELSDHHVTIPMFGFTQSFNISVSAALSLYVLRNKLKLSKIDWQLSDKEKIEVMIDWLTHMIAAGDNIKQKFLKEPNE